MKKKNSIIKNSAYLYIRMLVVLGTSLYTVRIVLHALGVTDYGIYGVAGGIVAVFSFLNNTMSSAAQRFLGIDIGRGDNSALGKTFNATLVVHVLISVALLFLGETVGVYLVNRVLNIPSGRDHAANIVLHLSVLATIALILKAPLNALIIARQRMWFFSMTSIVEALLKLMIAFLIVRANMDRLIFYAILVCAVSWIMLLWYFIFCRMNFEESAIKIHRDMAIYGSLFYFIGWSFIGSLSNVFRTQGANALLNMFFGPTLNAAHGVMTQAQAAATQFSGSFQTALSPQIYQSYGQGSPERTYMLVSSGAKLNFILLSLLVAPAIYGMDYLLKIWLGVPPQYAASFIRMMLLVVLVESISQPLMIAAAASGVIRNYQLSVGGVVLLNVPITWIAFKIGYGPLSFLYIALVVQILAFGLRVWFLQGMIGLSVSSFFKGVVFPILLSAVIGLGVLYYLRGVLGSPHDFCDFIIGCGTITTVFAGTGFIFALSRSERRYITGAFLSKLK